MQNWWNFIGDWFSGIGRKLEKMRTEKKHTRTGYTKTPLYMRKAANRKRNKAARQARKRSRPRYTRR